MNGALEVWALPPVVVRKVAVGVANTTLACHDANAVFAVVGPGRSRPDVAVHEQGRASDPAFNELLLGQSPRIETFIVRLVLGQELLVVLRVKCSVGCVAFSARRRRRATAGAGFVVPDQTILAAFGQASALASVWVEEEAFSALAEVDAGLAHAAVSVPDLAARAASAGHNKNSTDALVDGRWALAVAAASQIIPREAIGAFLDVAGALALLSIPVE